MNLHSNIGKATSFVLLLMLAFVSLHDGAFALVTLTGGNALMDVNGQGDCENSAEHREDSCSCPAHLLENIKDSASVFCLLNIRELSHASLPALALSSRSLLPSEPPPKA